MTVIKKEIDWMNIEDKIEEIKPRTFRFYEEDVNKFKEFCEKNNMKQKDSFKELVKIMEKTIGGNKKGQLWSFFTEIKNEFEQKKERKRKVFSITGNYLNGFAINEGELRLGPIHKYQITDQYRTVEIENLKKWNSAINKEFGIQLNIKEDMNQYYDNEVYRGGKFQYYFSFSLQIYEDVVRNKYLVYDHFRIRLEDIQYGHRKILDANRFFYVSNSQELKNKLDQDIYLYLPDNEKEMLVRSIDDIQVINSRRLEEELQKYYQ